MSISTETKTEPDTAQADITERVIVKPDIAQPDTAQQGETRPATTAPTGPTRSKFGRRARWGLGLLSVATGSFFVGWLATAAYQAHQQHDAAGAGRRMDAQPVEITPGARRDDLESDDGPLPRRAILHTRPARLASPPRRIAVAHSKDGTTLARPGDAGDKDQGERITACTDYHYVH